ncbi:MAG: glycosyltransferase [Bacteroidetes bacterium]|nr:glycosyltransferase [Bacteroidota bacterium]
MTSTTHFLFDALQILVLVLLGWPLLYLLFFAIAGRFYKAPKSAAVRPAGKIVVLIPAYREDSVIVDVAQDALRQDFPKEKFEVVVIADSLQEQTLSSLRRLPVTLIEVRFEQSTKTKALNRAMTVLGDGFDIAVILDADNIMAPDFLRRISGSLTGDLVAVQGHRTAKNQDSPLALLDAASEEINNHIFRKGHVAAGLSSAIIGSGMAFRYGFFKELMSGVKAVGGFDKEIELKILQQGFRIGYDSEALVFDEKIRKATAFKNQRRRWLAAQLTYFKTDIGQAFTDLVTRGNIDYFDKAVQFILPPRILLLGAVFLSMALFLPANIILEKPAVLNFLWMMAGSMCIAVFGLSLPRSFYHRKTLRALLTLPRGMVLMLVSLWRIKGANRQFLHTEHGTGFVTNHKMN